MKKNLYILLALCFLLTATSCRKEEQRNTFAFNTFLCIIDNHGQIAPQVYNEFRIRDMLLTDSDPVTGWWLYCHQNTPNDTLLYLTRDDDGFVRGELRTVFDFGGCPGQTSFPVLQGEMKEKYGMDYFEGTASVHCIFNHTASGQYYEPAEYTFNPNCYIVSIFSKNNQQPHYTMNLEGVYTEHETGNERDIHLTYKNIVLYDQSQTTAYFRNGAVDYHIDNNEDMSLIYIEDNHISPQGWMDLSSFDTRFDCQNTSPVRLHPTEVTEWNGLPSFSGTFEFWLEKDPSLPQCYLNKVTGSFTLRPK